MFKIKSLSIRNFQSFGNVQQGIEFDNANIVLVMGENLDLGGSDYKNGVGKSGFVSALTYALYGEAIGKIKKDNLINKINAKDMLVTLDFEVNGSSYRLERGRKPNVLRFLANGQVYGNTVTDEAQGDNKETQKEIERVIGMSSELFKHIVALNTEVLPFLSLGANDQRNLIEELLGITKLSEKADKLRELIKVTKDDIKEEEWKIKSYLETNKKTEDNIRSIELKSAAWTKSKNQKIEDLNDELAILLNIDISQEEQYHLLNQDYKNLNQMLTTLQSDEKKLLAQIKSAETSIKECNTKLSKIEDCLCPSCNQSINVETNEKLKSNYNAQLESHNIILDKLRKELIEMQDGIKEIILPQLNKTHYNSLEEVYSHKNQMELLGSKLEYELSSVNPYIEQIENLKLSAIYEISYESLNNLSHKRDHQEFLLKLLTNKDSFIRKKIIDHNLLYLNSRMCYYLEKMGLPHEVKFKSDLEVEITQYGKDYDFANLSRGEKTRLILSLSWAFRDVFESLNHKINLMIVDELIDSGLDTNGIESALHSLKQMVKDVGRSCYLISHREELIGRVDEILKVTKENSFTTFSKGY